MTSASESRREVRRIADEKLGVIGFRRTGRFDVYLRTVSEGVSAWLGLNRAHGRDADGDLVIEVNPIVGVRHDMVEDLVFRFLGLPRSPAGAQYVVPIGYLMPDPHFRQWPVSTPLEAERSYADIVAALAQWGIPMVMRNVELADFARNLETTTHGYPWQNVYALAACYVLLGRPGDAERVLDAFGRPDRLAGAFGRSFQRFRTELRRFVQDRDIGRSTP